MIHNDQELAVTQQRIAYFQRVLAQLRVTASPEEFPAVASGYRAEIVRMQACGSYPHSSSYSLYFNYRANFADSSHNRLESSSRRASIEGVFGWH